MSLTLLHWEYLFLHFKSNYLVSLSKMQLRKSPNCIAQIAESQEDITGFFYTTELMKHLDNRQLYGSVHGLRIGFRSLTLFAHGRL